MVFKEVETDVWKPTEKDQQIEGILIHKEANVGVNKSEIYTIEVEGKPFAVWGSAILDTKMLAVNVGDKTKIVYLGLGSAKQGHNPPKLFQVFVDKDLSKDE